MDRIEPFSNAGTLPRVGAQRTIPVSVVIPAFNREQLLHRALTSVAAQTVRPAQVVVVDDCSHDTTAAVAASFGADVVSHSHNRGAAAARNSGIAAAAHDWLALLDSDDEWLPFHLETVWAARRGHVVVAGSALYLDRQGRPFRVVGPADWSDRRLTSPLDLLYPENIVSSSAALVLRDAVQQVGGYDVTLRNAEDFDLWTKLLRIGPGRVLATVTAIYHRHEGQKSATPRASRRAKQIIVPRIVDSPAGARLARRRLGARLWDDLRARLKEGDLRSGAQDTWQLVSRPSRLWGAIGVWSWRRRTRRRSYAVLPDGRTRVALLSGPLPAVPLRAERDVLEDLREAGWRRYPAIWRRPPRRAIATRRRERLVCALAGVDVEAG